MPKPKRIAKTKRVEKILADVKQKVIEGILKQITKRKQGYSDKKIRKDVIKLFIKELEPLPEFEKIKSLPKFKEANIMEGIVRFYFVNQINEIVELAEAKLAEK